MCLRIGFCPKCVICKCVEEFRVCCQSSNEKAFEEFSQGVIEIYASVGCWVCFVLILSFVDSWVVGGKVARVVCEIPIDR